MSASEGSVNCNKNSDTFFGRKACTLKKKMDVPQKMRKSFYECSKCSMTFRRKDYLESHERCHIVEKPYVCSFCDKAFTDSGTLGVHILAKYHIQVRNAVKALLKVETCPQHAHSRKTIFM
ncbi:hypothetical protein CEXT_267791 [Caerostris extrusa]|uniref:C2H2-type domain-containing protein n=1 Tax=Caerostris extrusa TaxID=172846 RepID=A0AAV4YET7_CAEEX|nr:hypothetical protein CEXT_267791 [Caerostris extrusa]